MATIDSKKIIDEIILANGKQYDDEPQVVKIIAYTNAWGKVTYGVVWEGDGDLGRYEVETPFVQNPQVIWAYKGGEG